MHSASKDFHEKKSSRHKPNSVAYPPEPKRNQRELIIMQHAGIFDGLHCPLPYTKISTQILQQTDPSHGRSHDNIFNILKQILQNIFLPQIDIDNNWILEMNSF